MEKIISERGKPLILYQGYKFYKYREVKTTGELCWCCILKTCKVKLFTIGSDEIFSKLSGGHEHPSVSVADLNRQKINNSLKRKLEGNTSEKPSKLIHLEINKQKTPIETLTTKDIKCIRNNISYNKLKLIPKLPQSASEVQEFLDSVAITTLKNENFLLINNKEKNIVVFSCEKNLKFMCNQETLFMDGTFDFCTKYFLQLFTIHAYSNNIYVPVVFCLLLNKKKSTYTELFQLIREKCTESGYHLLPKTVVVDYEIAIHLSLQDNFPAANIVGCRFHLTQAW